MSLIKVTAEDLQNLSANVMKGSGSIQDQLSLLQGEVSSVVGADWMGAASGAFHARYEEWNRSAAMLKDALDGISQLLAQAGMQYQQTEDAIRSWMHPVG
jgi:WXG100 family type VII secretion target